MSPLKLNAGLGQLDAWDEAAIQERAGRLADQALAVWTAPKLDGTALATYQPEFNNIVPAVHGQADGVPRCAEKNR